MKRMNSYHKHIETPAMNTDEIARQTPINNGEILCMVVPVTPSLTFSIGFSEVSA